MALQTDVQFPALNMGPADSGSAEVCKKKKPQLKWHLKKQVFRISEPFHTPGVWNGCWVCLVLLCGNRGGLLGLNFANDTNQEGRND